MATAARKHIAIKIYGNVRGVSFRVRAKQEARPLGISGFARNEPDGSVYIEVEGNAGAIEKFLSWCRTGPPFAKVEKVDFALSDSLRNFGGFDVQ